MRNNMKKIFIFAIALATLTSCAKFLDTKPEGTPNTDNYFQSDFQVESALKSIYSPMIDGDDCFGRNTIWAECLGTQMVVGRNSGDWSRELTCLTWNGDEFGLRNPYEWFYKFIARANWIVDGLLEQKETRELSYVEKRSLGEAYFLRAFFHYWVANLYGCAEQGVPFVRYEDFEGGYDYSIPTQQPSVTDNYNMIVEDLKKAEEWLPDFRDYSQDERGRAQKQAAVALMAKAYAYWATWDKSQWKNVVDCVNKLETTYGRALNPSFSELFCDDISKWWNAEYCWSIPSNGGHMDRVGAEFPGLCLENKGYGIYNGWGNFKASYDAFEEFVKDGDRDVNERLEKSILQYGQPWMYSGSEMNYYSSADIETGFGINKWLEPFGHANMIDAGYANEGEGSWVTGRVNYHVVRFADVLLLRAEANLAQGNASAAAKDLNAIRQRAGLEPNCKGTWEEIYHERYCELAYEPMASHAQDLRRWAYSGDATIAALAIKEMESHPRALYHVWRDWPESPVGQGVGETGNIIELGLVMNPAKDGSGVMTMRQGKEYTSIDESKAIGEYQNYQNLEGKWDKHLVVYPYPSLQITNSAGALKQNPGY